MASAERQAENKRIEEENLFKSLSATEKQAETDAFQCSRCKQVCHAYLFQSMAFLMVEGIQRKCIYRQAQTRSADEPMTVCDRFLMTEEDDDFFPRRL
jgi:transcription elongation factor S-II